MQIRRAANYYLPRYRDIFLSMNYRSNDQDGSFFPSLWPMNLEGDKPCTYSLILSSTSTPWAMCGYYNILFVARCRFRAAFVDLLLLFVHPVWKLDESCIYVLIVFAVFSATATTKFIYNSKFSFLFLVRMFFFFF